MEGPGRAVPGALAAQPFSCLWFPAGEDEIRFSEAYVARCFGPVDRPRHKYVLAVVLAFAWGRMRDDYRDFGALSAGGTYSLVASALCICLHRLWVELEVETRQRRRAGFIVATRLVTCNLPLAFLTTVWWRTPVTGLGSLFGFMLLSSGALGLLFHTFLSPLLARHHLLLQLPTVAFMAAYTPARACTASVLTPEGGPYIEAAWRWLGALTGAAVAMPTPPTQVCCWDIVIVTQVVIGLWLPSYVLWAAEYWARCRYDPASPRLTWAAVAVHVMLFMTLMACLWTLLYARTWGRLGWA